MHKKTITTTRVLLLNEGRVFLMLRNGKGSSHGGHKRWIAPGGVTEKDESAMDCVIRETEEEIGLKLKPENLTVLLEQYDPKFNANMVFYVCEKWEGQIKISPDERAKFDWMQWIKLEEVKSLDHTHNAHLGMFIAEAVDLLLTQMKASNVKTSPLTGSRSPDELLGWMNKRLTYHGIRKDFLFRAEEVVKQKSGHCWEIAELAYVELSALGYECRLLYLEKEDLSVTHTTLFYKDRGQWCWFEWAWGAYVGIVKNFKTLDDAIEHVRVLFNDDQKKITMHLGYSPITKNMTQLDYIGKVNTWAIVKHCSSKKPVYSKW